MGLHTFCPSCPLSCGLSRGLLVPIMVVWMGKGYPVSVEMTGFNRPKTESFLSLIEPKIGKWKPLMYLLFNHFRVYLCSSTNLKMAFQLFLVNKGSVSFSFKQNSHPLVKKNIALTAPTVQDTFIILKTSIHTLKILHLHYLHELLLITFMKSRQR